jgi:hypothetical protein
MQPASRPICSPRRERTNDRPACFAISPEVGLAGLDSIPRFCEISCAYFFVFLCAGPGLHNSTAQHSTERDARPGFRPCLGSSPCLPPRAPSPPPPLPLCDAGGIRGVFQPVHLSVAPKEGRLRAARVRWKMAGLSLPVGLWALWDGRVGVARSDCSGRYGDFSFAVFRVGLIACPFWRRCGGGWFFCPQPARRPRNIDLVLSLILF